MATAAAHMSIALVLSAIVQASHCFNKLLERRTAYLRICHNFEPNPMWTLIVNNLKHVRSTTCCSLR